MTEVLNRRASASPLNIIAVLLFIGVYVGALTLMFAPGDLLKATPASAVQPAD